MITWLNIKFVIKNYQFVLKVIMLIELQLPAFFSNLEEVSNYSSSTLEAYKNDLNRFIRYLKESIQRKPTVPDFTTGAISEYLKNERESGFKPSTLYRRRASLRRFAAYLKEKGLLLSDLTKEDTPFLPSSERKKVVDGGDLISITEPEVSNLIEVVSSYDNPRAIRDLAIFQLLFEIGISIGDLVSLNIADFIYHQKSLRIISPENEEENRPIPKSANLIYDYINSARKDLTQDHGETALFVSQMGGRVSRQGTWQGIRNWGKEAKLSVDLSPRIIRHTATKAMIKAGKKIEEIQFLLGHQNIFSTRTLVRRLRRSANFNL